MRLTDFILNLAGLLLWASWRAAPTTTPPATLQKPLLNTLRRAVGDDRVRWGYLVALPLLLLLRAIIYQWIGPAVNWSAQLDLVVVTVPFRSDQLPLMLLYSLLSFLRALVAFYVCLFLLSAVAEPANDFDPLRRMIRSNLNVLDRSPAWLKLILPAPLVALLWTPVGLWLAQLGLLPATASVAPTIQAGVVIGLASLVVWKYLVTGVMLLYLLHSYVYFGGASFWATLEVVGRNLLWPLRWIPLRLARVDFSPVLLMALVFLLGELAERHLTRLYQRLPL